MSEGNNKLDWEGVLLAMMTKNPRAKIAATPSFCFIFICSFMTMVMGKLMTCSC